ncbi:hypothetical protein B0H10DRAFT_2137590 [Mycena sp. CBHHK59/15]|nr:hypothetical protein B0H10DRAFT_2137590 [Mycena sp. CBHHK59/15]
MSAKFTNKACTGSGTIQIDYIATGWAWFREREHYLPWRHGQSLEYDSKVDGHYYWALNMVVGANVVDRTSSLEFNVQRSLAALLSPLRNWPILEKGDSERYNHFC